MSINPSLVKYSNDKAVEPEKLAQAFSEIFGITYEEALEKAFDEGYKDDEIAISRTSLPLSAFE